MKLCFIFLVLFANSMLTTDVNAGTLIWSSGAFDATWPARWGRVSTTAPWNYKRSYDATLKREIFNISMNAPTNGSCSWTQSMANWNTTSCDVCPGCSPRSGSCCTGCKTYANCSGTFMMGSPTVLQERSISHACLRYKSYFPPGFEWRLGGKTPGLFGLGQVCAITACLSLFKLTNVCYCYTGYTFWKCFLLRRICNLGWRHKLLVASANVVWIEWFEPYHCRICPG